VLGVAVALFGGGYVCHYIALDMHRVNCALALVLETEAVVVSFRVIDSAVQVLEIDAGVESIKECLKENNVMSVTGPRISAMLMRRRTLV